MTYAGVQEQEVIKITGHASSSSLKPYLQTNQEHHNLIINKLRNQETTSTLPNTRCQLIKPGGQAFKFHTYFCY
ncbi:hypothetical protein C0J52_15673 [Blattella germanica]|nr:hypothetical protein C0J52_15673 [Blattella germanica]